MELSFSGHSKTTRTVDFDKADFAVLSDAVRASFLQHIKYANFNDIHTDYDRKLVSLCEKYGVDPFYTPDRLAFFSAIMEGK